MPKLLRKIWLWTATSIGALLILLAMAVGLFRLFLPQLPEYQAQIETWAGQALGRPLSFGSIDARLSLAGPRVVFRDTRVLSLDGQTPVMDAESISVVVSPMALLLEGELAVSGVRIEGVTLDVVHREDGRFEILNRVFPVPPGETAPRGPGARIPDGRYEIRDATLRLTSAARPDEYLVFRETSLDMDKDAGDMSLGVSVRPPESLSGPIRITASTTSMDLDPGSRQWQILVQVQQMDLAGWVGLLPDSFPVNSGAGSVTLWLSTTGGLVDGAIADLDLRGLGLSPGDPYPATEFERLRGKFEYETTPGGQKFKVRDLAVSRQGQSWEAASVRMEMATGAGDGRLLYLAADRLRLDDMRPFFPLVPNQDARDRLVALAPRGVISRLDLQYASDGEEGASYSVRADLAGLGIDAVGKFPGVTGLTGELVATRESGTFNLASVGLGVDMPRVFSRPIVLDDAHGRISWRRMPGGLNVAAEDVVLANADIYTYSTLSLDLPEGDESPFIDLETQIKNGRVEAKTPYLPLVKLSPKVRQWLDRALVSGRIPEGRLVLRGPLNRFPFHAGEGRFLVDFGLEDVLLDYQEGWPAIENLSARVRFEGPGLFTELTGGNMAGNRIVGGRADIPRLKDAMLQVQATTRGKVTAGLDYLAAIPPGERFRDTIASLETGGEATVKVDLQLPLKDASENRLVLDMDIEQGSVRPTGLKSPLEQIDGTLRLEGGALHGQGLTGSFRGKPVRIELSPDPSVSQGRATLMLLRGWSDGRDLMDEFFPIMTDRVSGKTDWFAVARFPSQETGEPVTVSARSVLGGLGIDLPEPMGKHPEDVRLLELFYTMGGEEERRLDLALGDDTRAHLVFAPTAQGWALGSGEVVLGGGVPARSGPPGLGISGRTAYLPLDSWLALEAGSVETAASADPASADPASADAASADAASADAASADAASADAASVDPASVDPASVDPASVDPASVDPGVRGVEQILKRMDLQVDELVALGQELGPASLALENVDRQWVARVISDKVAGTIIVPQDPEGELPIRADLDRLIIGVREDHPEEPGLVGPRAAPARTDPRDLRPHQVQAREFAIGDMHFGSMEAVISRAPMGLNLEVLRTRHPAFSGEGAGSWLVTDEGQMTGLKFRMNSTDILETFKSLGLGEIISGRRASADWDVYWRGGPDSDLVHSLSGQVQLLLEDGTVADIDPGAGRALGLLSIATLPRRLTLDFRDVFSEGLAFDRISGDFNLVDGNAYTSNMVMKGPSVGIGMSGRTGLAERTYDQLAVVHANIGSTLPLAGALAGGPTLGAALLIFSEVFKEPLQGITRARYKVTGSWDDPKVERLEFSEAAPPPAESIPAEQPRADHGLNETDEGLVGPMQREPGSDDAAGTEAADTEAADTEAADTEAADTEAADTEAADTEAADTEAADTEAADAGASASRQGAGQ